MPRVLLLSVGVLLWVGGCNSPAQRLNAPPHGQALRTSDMQGTFTYMADNALLADMTISDMHFLPHRAALNDLGVQRLSRLASLLEAYGGTIRFNTDLTDKELVSRRIEAVRDFLAEAGIDTTREVVVRDIPGGEGMAATEALLIKQHEGTYQPRRESGAVSPESAEPKK